MPQTKPYQLYEEQFTLTPEELKLTGIFGLPRLYRHRSLDYTRGRVQNSFATEEEAVRALDNYHNHLNPTKTSATVYYYRYRGRRRIFAKDEPREAAIPV